MSNKASNPVQDRILTYLNSLGGTPEEVAISIRRIGISVSGNHHTLVDGPLSQVLKQQFGIPFQVGFKYADYGETAIPLPVACFEFQRACYRGDYPDILRV